MSSFKIVECSGAPRECGRQTGEQLREEIREHIALRSYIGPAVPEDEWQRRRAACTETMGHHIPEYLEELEGMAEGADLPLDSIHRINFMLWPDTLRGPDPEGCTNIVFRDGPDGPVWGKNNDGNSTADERPACARIVRPDNGIPLVTFTFCGTVAVTDGMNAEGLVMGHSSVGSVFQQSDRHMPIRPWTYYGLQRCRTTAEFVDHLASQPTRGKGYSMVVVDRDGSACSLECPCPLVQVRHPADDEPWIFCVNAYLLPALRNADRRTPEAKADALARVELLHRELTSSAIRDGARMQELLALHGTETGICRHADRELLNTHYGIIAFPSQGRTLVAPGQPCETPFEEVRF